MANKIKESDLFDGRVFEQSLLDAKELLKTSLELKKVKIASMPVESSDNIKSLTEELQKIKLEKQLLVEVDKKLRLEENKAIQQKEKQRLAEIKLQKDREKAFDNYEKQLRKQQKEEAKSIQQKEKLRLEENKAIQQKEKQRLAEIKLQKDREKAFNNYEKQLRKQQKEEAKESKKELDAYQQKSKELNELRKLYKATAVSQGLASKETKKLAKEVQKLDKELKEIDESAGQFQRNVGNYPKVTENARKGFSSLSGFLVGTVVGAFVKSRESAREFQGAIERIQNALNVLAKAILLTFTQVIIPTFKEWILRLQAGKELLKLNFEEAEKLTEQADEQAKKVKSLSSVWGGLGEVFKEVDDIVIRKLKLQDELINQSVLLETSIAKLQGREDALSVSVGDSTISFEAQLQAIRDVLKVQGQRVEQELQLARIRKEIALADAEAQLTANQAFKGLNEEQRKNLLLKLRDLSFVKDKQLADKVTIETLDALKVAYIAETQAISNSVKFKKEQSKEERQIQQDIFEQRLDVLLDAFDNQKTINERIVADEKKVFDERRAVLERTKALNEQNKKDQEKLFVEQTGLQIDLNDLVNTDDQKLLEQKLFRLKDLSEIERQRLLEVIRDQRTANQDLIDAENDLTQAIIESRERRDASLKAIADRENEFQIQQNERRFDKELEQQEQAIFFKTKQLKELTKLNEGEQILLLEREKQFAIAEANKIVDTQERNAKLLELESEFQRKLFDINQDAADKIAEINERKRIKDIEFIEETLARVFELTKENLDKTEQAQRDAIDREIDYREQRTEESRRRAELGLSNTLAFEEAQRVKAELKAQEFEKRQARKRQLIADVEAFQAAYLTNLKQPNANSTQALTKALADIGKFKALKTVIGGFAYDGVEDTGDAGTVDNKGGKLWVLHPNERVLSKKENEPLLKMGVKNSDVPNLVAMGLQYQNSMPNLVASARLNSGNLGLIQEIRELKEVVKNKTEYKDFTDKHGNHVTEMMQKGMKRTITYVKAKPRI
jgi:hypothetical protein